MLLFHLGDGNATNGAYRSELAAVLGFIFVSLELQPNRITFDELKSISIF